VRVNAFDPDNPSYLPPDRASDGTLIKNDVFLPTVHYQISGLPSGATFDPETQILTWTPDFASAGEHQFTVTAIDDGNGLGQPLSTTQTVRVVVLNTNRAPQIPQLQNQTVDHDTTLSIPLGATDPDGNPVQLTITGLPAFG
ncbi:putative Ig domain-containing protein, partial [Xanthomonas citri pv. citri]